MKLSIVVLNYNTKDLTLDCIASIVEQYEKELEKGEFEIILLDNNSTDASANAFRKLRIKNLKFVQNEENVGFSKGNNIGVKNASGEYILFLNSDTEIKDKGLIRMIEFLDEHTKVAILGGKLENADGSVQKSCGNFYSLFNLFLLLYGGGKLGLLTKSPKKISKVDWVSGACMMIRADIFRKIGGFEEKLFMYMEDVELCYRAFKKNYLTYFYPNVTLIHKERGSSNRTFAIIHIYEGILFFYKKYMPEWQYGIARRMLRTKALTLVILSKIINNKYLEETYSKALEL